MRSLIGIFAVKAEEQSLFSELWEYFYNTYIDPSEYYENLNITSSDLLFIRLLILGLCVGLSLAAFGAVFNKRVLGGIVRKILKAEVYLMKGFLLWARQSESI